MSTRIRRREIFGFFIANLGNKKNLLEFRWFLWEIDEFCFVKLGEGESAREVYGKH